MADNIAAQYVDTRPINSRPSSSFSFDLVRKWFTECHESHEVCRRRRTGYTPSRLIEIQLVDGTGRLKLRSNSKEILAYAALSYCWGGDQPVKTTKATIQEFSRVIPYLDLPKTVQDAITTTFELHLRFIWINCFSIIQDDLEDKAKEIALMPQKNTECLEDQMPKHVDSKRRKAEQGEVLVWSKERKPLPSLPPSPRQRQHNGIENPFPLETHQCVLYVRTSTSSHNPQLISETKASNICNAFQYHFTDRNSTVQQTLALQRNST